MIVSAVSSARRSEAGVTVKSAFVGTGSPSRVQVVTEYSGSPSRWAARKKRAGIPSSYGKTPGRATTTMRCMAIS